MALHLNYDGNQQNGIIFNAKYSWGALYKGIHLKPSLSFEYDSMQCSEVFDTGNYVLYNGTYRKMTKGEEKEVTLLASTWVQPPEQEGGIGWEAKKAENTERDALASEVNAVCIQALIDAGYTQAQLDLFFPDQVRN